MHLRIVRTRYKLLYLAVWIGVTVVVRTWVFPHVSAVVVLVVSPVVFLGFFVVAVRSFRGAREPVYPPRAWWRVTGGVPSGFVLAVLWLALAAVGVLQFVGLYPWESQHLYRNPTDLANALLWLAISAFYFSSAIRLRRWSRVHPDLPVEVVTTAAPLKGVE